MLVDSINTINGCGTTNDTVSPCRSRIFSYTLGADADTGVAKEISCASAGTWTPVVDNGNLRGQMASYYDFYASQRVFQTDESKVRWVEPYEDAFGAGTMTTASTALYDESTSPPTLVGVVGIDLLLTDITAAAESSGVSLINALATRSKTCATTEVIPGSCALARIREGTATTETTASTLFRNGVVTTSRLCADDQKGCNERPEGACLGAEADAGRKTLSAKCDGTFDVTTEATHQSCCSSSSRSGLTKGEIAAIVIGVLALLVIIIVFVVCAVHKSGEAGADPNRVHIEERRDDTVVDTVPPAFGI